MFFGQNHFKPCYFIPLDRTHNPLKPFVVQAIDAENEALLHCRFTCDITHSHSVCCISLLHFCNQWNSGITITILSQKLLVYIMHKICKRSLYFFAITLKSSSVHFILIKYVSNNVAYKKIER